MKKTKNSSNRRDGSDDKTPVLPAKAKSGGFNWGRKAAPEKADWRNSDAEFSAESTRYASPLPSRNHILKTLVEAAEPMTLDELIAHFGLKKLNEQEAFAKRLVAMAREGQVTAADRRGAYRAVLTESGDTIEAKPRSGILVDGKVLAHRDGYGFVQPDNAAPGDKSGDVFLSPRQMNSLMNGDRVRVRVTGTDLLTRDLHANVIARIDDPATEADDALEIEDPADETGESAGPLTLAIDLQDAVAEEPTQAPAPDSPMAN